MSKYKVDSAARISVDIYIDTSNNGCRVLRSNCPWQQGQSLCKGDPKQVCNQTWGTCNAPEKNVCLDEIGKYEGKLPEHIVKESSQWAIETWGLSSYIESQSIAIDPKTGERIMDLYKLKRLKIKYLLRSWTLGDSDLSLKIRVRNVLNTRFEEIPEDVMVELEGCRRDILDAFYSGYVSEASKGENPTKNSETRA